MTRERLVGMPLEFFLAAAMSPRGQQNYNISRYISLDGALDVDALVGAINGALADVGVGHYAYTIDAAGAWRAPAADFPCRASLVDLRGSTDPRRCCLAAIDDEVSRALPILSGDPKARAIVYLLERAGERVRAIYYHRFHHVELDGYSAQELYLRRMAELYNAFSRGEAPTPPDFEGYCALLDEEEQYERSRQFSEDRAFWRAYLAEYLMRTQDHPPRTCEESATPVSYGVEIARDRDASAMRPPIDAMTAAILVTLYQLSGVSCQMMGVTFMRRSKGRLDRVISPMATVLPLWVDLSRSRDSGAVTAQVAAALRTIKSHQFYGGERAVRDLGYTGRTDGLYLLTANYRVFDRRPIVFDRVESASQILAIGPASGITLVVSLSGRGLRNDLKSRYRRVYGVDVGDLTERLAANMADAIGGADRLRRSTACAAS